MTGGDRIAGVAEVAVDDVQIGAAHAAGADGDQQLPGFRLRNRQLLQPQRLPGSVQLQRAHGTSDGTLLRLPRGYLISRTGTWARWMTLMATRREATGSYAAYTTPMPPDPISCKIR